MCEYTSQHEAGAAPDHDDNQTSGASSAAPAPERSARTAAAAWEAALRTVHAILRDMEQEMDDAGLPLTWYDVLIQLHAADESGLRMKDLADRVVLSRSGLTRLVDRMEEAALVRRNRSKGDRRGFNVVLTPAGRERFEALRPGHLESIELHFGQHLDEGDARAVIDAMRKVREGRRRED